MIDHGGKLKRKSLIDEILSLPPCDMTERALKKKSVANLRKCLKHFKGRQNFRARAKPEKGKVWKGTEVWGKVRNFRPSTRY